MAASTATAAAKSLKRASAGIVSDPIADMLTRVRNANTARHPEVRVPASKLKLEIARVLKDEGYIAGYEIESDGTAKVTASTRPLPVRPRVAMTNGKNVRIVPGRPVLSP